MAQEKPIAFSNLSQFLGNVQRQKLALKKNANQSVEFSRLEKERKNVLDLNIVVGVDCSGSISPTMYNDFMVQLDHIKGMSRIKVVEVASIIRAVYDFTTRKDSIVRLQGGGGNGELLFFPMAKAMKPDAIIYMTDGYCTSASNPKIPTAWILTNTGVQPYDWGTVVGRLPH